MLFHTTDELQITVCGVVKAMTLHDEAIRVGFPHLLPPM